MTEELMKLKRANDDPRRDSRGGPATGSLEGRLTSLRKVKERCVYRCQSCLRFWQLSKAAYDTRALGQPKGYIAHVSLVTTTG